MTIGHNFLLAFMLAVISSIYLQLHKLDYSFLDFNRHHQLFINNQRMLLSIFDIYSLLILIQMENGILTSAR